MEIPCGVVRDLLPLYHDNVCGEESRDLVAEHVAACEGCKKALDAFKDEATDVYQPTPSELKMLGALAKLKHKQFRWRFFAIVLAVVCTAVIVTAFTRYTLRRQLPIPYEEGMLTVAVDEDSYLRIVPNKNSLTGSAWFERKVIKDGNEYNAIYFHYWEQLYERLPWNTHYYSTTLNGIMVGSIDPTITREDILMPQSYYWGADRNQWDISYNVGAIYYLEKELGSVNATADDATFAKQTEGAILIWEREKAGEIEEGTP
ncbi:MAG: zf-HC2 domain-containing protein [Oscillospiraceae bacterium]|jgi:hypothetical protein|nr:zf-HC2 domain-containing protein [Oscillospiraceae bacterium]